jgi:chemotaxis protein methyltransferase CheR
MSAINAQDSLSIRQFSRLASFIEDYSGIKMPPVKKVMVEGRLRRRVHSLGLSSLDDYCEHLFDRGELENEVIHLIDAVTTNKTEFFREPQHFDFVATRALPTLLAASGAGRDRPLKAWSAACSVGAEPYTLAMVISEFGSNYRGFRFSILATDICTDVVGKAFLGIYSEDMVAPVPPHLRKRYFMRSRDPARRQVRVVPEIRSCLRFARLNLMDESYPVSDDIDLILCRNILIYFDKPTQEAVLCRLCRHLRPGGYLIIGHSEATAGFNLPLRSVAPTVFMRE